MPQTAAESQSHIMHVLGKVIYCVNKNDNLQNMTGEICNPHNADAREHHNTKFRDTQRK